MKYIILYVISRMVLDVCPDYKPDKFGAWPAYSCAASHYTRRIDTLTYVTYNRDSAAMFMDECKNRKVIYFKIDSIKNILNGRKSKTRR